MAFPVLAAVRPPSIGDSANGQIPLDVLRNVRLHEDYDVFLAKEAALAYEQLCSECMIATGVTLGISAGGAFRTLRQQEILFDQRYEKPAVAGRATKFWPGHGLYSIRYVNGKPLATAAVPGTSLHGLASAVDLKVFFAANPNVYLSACWDWLLANAIRLGWSWELQSEPWHLHLVKLPGAPAPTLIPPEEDDDMAALHRIVSPIYAAEIVRFSSGLLGWANHAESVPEQFEETDDAAFVALMQGCTVPAIPASQQALKK